MDPRRLQTFRAVARAGSLSAAARDLGWTQPAVSQQLQRLEREAGTPLLLRGPKGVRLTQAGELLLRRADRLAAELHMATEEMAALAQLRRGRVRLIAFPSAVATIVPEALRRLRLAQPGIDVSLAEAEPPEAVTALREDNADLAVTFAYDEPRDVHGEIVWLPVVTEPVDLVLPATHPAAVSRRLTLAVLADETWIGGCVRCRAHLVERCRAAGFEPRLSHATDDYVAVQALVGAGLGVSLLP
ncbi:MAG: LysR family transcriptional regulator, partial [Nocardioides sp.]